MAAWVVALPFGALWVLWTAATQRLFGGRGAHSVWEMGAVNLFVTYLLANMLLRCGNVCGLWEPGQVCMQQSIWQLNGSTQAAGHMPDTCL